MEKQQKIDLRNKIGSLPALTDEGYAYEDNLGIALATYFQDHPGCPEDDEMDAECGWGTWVMEKTDDVLDRVVEALLGKDGEQ